MEAANVSKIDKDIFLDGVSNIIRGLLSVNLRFTVLELKKTLCLARDFCASDNDWL